MSVNFEFSAECEELLLFCSRYSNISCELLTSDISQINDRLGEDEKLLMKLYGFLQNKPPLNPLLASFFSKVLSILIGRKPERVSWLEGGEGDWKIVTEKQKTQKLLRIHYFQLTF